MAARFFTHRTEMAIKESFFVMLCAFDAQSVVFLQQINVGKVPQSTISCEPEKLPFA